MCVYSKNDAYNYTTLWFDHSHRIDFMLIRLTLFSILLHTKFIHSTARNFQFSKFMLHYVLILSTFICSVLLYFITTLHHCRFENSHVFRFLGLETCCIQCFGYTSKPIDKMSLKKKHTHTHETKRFGQFNQSI